jgi:hypothetical protein
LVWYFALFDGCITKAYILNDQFTSVFSSEQRGDIPTKGNSPYSSVSDITVHQAGVYKLLYNINQHKATGPDTIPGKLITLTFDKAPESVGVAGLIVT